MNEHQQIKQIFFKLRQSQIRGDGLFSESHAIAAIEKLLVDARISELENFEWNASKSEEKEV